MNSLNEIRLEIESAANLDDLCDILNNIDHETMGWIDTSSLPVYGGKEPRETAGVWSWDVTHLMTTDVNGAFMIEPRCACGEATFHCKCDDECCND